jgi:ribose transport system substrate-binding protein
MGCCVLPRVGLPTSARRWAIFCVIAVLALLPATPGCSRREKIPEQAEAGNQRVHTLPAGVPLKLALVPNSASRFWDLAQSGLNKFEKETGIKVVMICPPHGTLEEQKSIIEDLVAQGYHGIMISVVAPEEQTPLINQWARRLNVVTVDSDAPKSQRLLFIGPQHYDMGLATGMAIVRALPNGGKVAIFAGDLAAENVVQRLRGINDAIRNQNIQIISVNEDRTDLTKARRHVEDVLRNYPGVNALVGLWSYNGGVIRNVVKAQGQSGTIKIVAFAEEEETLQGIEEGTILCGVAQTAFDCAYIGATVLRDLATKGASALPPGGAINTGFILVDQFNLPEIRETRMRQSSY